MKNPVNGVKTKIKTLKQTEQLSWCFMFQYSTKKNRLVTFLTTTTSVCVKSEQRREHQQQNTLTTIAQRIKWKSGKQNRQTHLITEYKLLG